MQKNNMSILPVLVFVLIISQGCGQGDVFKSNQFMENKDSINSGYNPLTDFEKQVVLKKSTERPFSGAYTDNKQKGTYLCRYCNLPLYRSSDKFESHCGWPSFDDEISGAVKRIPDADGQRTEIVCSGCGGHLGHVFEGEEYTAKNIRHCVNSVSMTFIPAVIEMKPERAIFAGGCFWGVEHLLQQQKGIISVVSGYIGGKLE